MSRRTFRTSHQHGTVCAPLFCLLALLATHLPAAERPNIIIFYADDMGYGDVGIQNPESKIPTPNLDQLARDGMRFTDAHSSSAICTPSRYALLTGRYHWRRFHDIVESFEPPVFAPGDKTMADILRNAGYRTACIGKWHLGWDWAAIARGPVKPARGKVFAAADFDWSKPIPGGPLDHGFDEYFGDDVPNFPPYTWFEGNRVVTAPTVPYEPNPRPREGAAEGRPGPMAAGWRLDAVMPRLTEYAVEWIGKQSADQPFLLYFPFTSPHAPIVPAAEFQGKSQAGPYGDFVTQTDATIGKVLEALKQQGLADNTLVIFSADNGPEHYAYERMRKYEHRSPGPLRGLKRDLWEGGHRVPLIVRWPDVIEPGTVCEALVSQIDLLATFAEIVDTPLTDEDADDSLSMLALLSGASVGPRKTMVHNTWANRYAVREGDWLLINAPSGDVSKVPQWYADQQGFEKNPHPAALYNLRDDLGQRKNLYASQPERVEQMQQLLSEIRAHGQRTGKPLAKINTGR